MNARAGKFAPGVVAALFTLSILAGCDGDRRSPTAVPPPPPPGQSPTPQSTVINYVGNSVVVSGGCGLEAGSSREGVTWRVEFGWNDDSIFLYEDMANYPSDHVTYVGTIQGFAFSALAEPQGCIVRGTLIGEFEVDFSWFSAESIWETLPSIPSGSAVVRQVSALNV